MQLDGVRRENSEEVLNVTRIEDNNRVKIEVSILTEIRFLFSCFWLTSRLLELFGAYSLSMIGRIIMRTIGSECGESVQVFQRIPSF